TAASSGATDTIAPNEWASPVILAQDGEDGEDGEAGQSVAELTIYRRSPSAPATPTDGSYNFATQTLTPTADWSSSHPAGTDPLYAARAVAAVQGTSGTDNSLTWSTPVLITQEGSAVDIIFTRSSTQPSTPPPSSGVPSGWSSDITSAPGSGPLWSSVGTRPNAGSAWTWQTPIRVEVVNSATVFLYQRTTTNSAPSLPGSTLTYPFETGLLSGSLGNWSQTIPPESNGSHLWVTTATALSAGPTDTIAPNEWAAVRKLGQAVTWRSGNGAPAGSLGNVGDWYLDEQTGNVYEKTGASTWTLRSNIQGPEGPQGPQGPAG